MTRAIAAIDNYPSIANIPHIVGIGDSRFANGIQSDASNVAALGRGFLNAARWKLRQRFRHDPRVWTDGGDCYAVSGYTTQNILDNGLITALLAAHAIDPIDIAFILASTNGRADVTQASFLTDTGNLTTIRNALVGAGIAVVWLDEMPRSDAGVTNWGSNGQRFIHMAVSQWLRSRVGLRGEATISSFNAMVDTTSAVSAPVAANFADSLHPNLVGGDVIGGLIATYLDPMLPRCDHLLAGGADLYDATNNPTGALNSNPMMLGTAGTVNAGITGTLADNWTATLTGGGSGVYTLSKYTHTDGTVWQKLVLSGTAAATGSIVIEQPSIGGSLATNDNVDIVGEFMVDAGQTGLNCVSLGCFDGGAAGGAKNRRDMWRVAATDAYPVTAQRGIQRIPRFSIATAGTTKPNFTITMLATALSATVYFRAVSAKKNLSFKF